MHRTYNKKKDGTVAKKQPIVKAEEVHLSLAEELQQQKKKDSAAELLKATAAMGIQNEKLKK
jgi:hypothetical protein